MADTDKSLLYTIAKLWHYVIGWDNGFWGGVMCAIFINGSLVTVYTLAEVLKMILM